MKVVVLSSLPGVQLVAGVYAVEPSTAAETNDVVKEKKNINERELG